MTICQIFTVVITKQTFILILDLGFSWMIALVGYMDYAAWFIFTCYYLVGQSFVELELWHSYWFFITSIIMLDKASCWYNVDSALLWQNICQAHHMWPIYLYLCHTVSYRMNHIKFVLYPFKDIPWPVYSI